MRTLIAVAATAGFLAGCASTPAQEAARVEREVDRMVQVYGPACAKLGYQRDTDLWRNCVMGLSARDDLARYGNTYATPFAHPYWYPYWRY
jgi:hypothetical protein